jgi:serine/threonine-protein kinase
MPDVAEELILCAKRRIGRVLKEKWRLDALIGVGGMAAVYAATHRAGKRVAVKILHQSLAGLPEIRGRFLREAYVANEVDHPDAVSVLDDDIGEDGSVFLVMELLDGETVEERRLRSGNSLPAAEVLWIADKLLDVLAAAHDKEIVHRDIKPENAFWTRQGALKVLDFGIARIRTLGGGIPTRSGTLLGTPAFMPPEQARGCWAEVGAGREGGRSGRRRDRGDHPPGQHHPPDPRRDAEPADRQQALLLH